MGPSGVPIPKQDYIDTVMEYYVLPNSPADTVAQTVFTPEGLYPITGVKSLELNTSVDQGIDILDLTMDELEAGTVTSVFGYSQSAIIGALMQRGYKGYTVPDDLADTTQFIFVGNELNPDGGLLSRFPGLTLPSLGLDFYGATPENAYPTFNYTQEYDGFADFPRYPLKFLSDLNAVMGIFLVHTRYTDPEYLPIGAVTPIARGGTAIELPTTSPLTQSYYFIRTENLPLLAPLRAIPIIGEPLAALVQPALKVIVDLGYGDPAHGSGERHHGPPHRVTDRREAPSVRRHALGVTRYSDSDAPEPTSAGSGGGSGVADDDGAADVFGAEVPEVVGVAVPEVVAAGVDVLEVDVLDVDVLDLAVPDVPGDCGPW